ncbi:MAG: glycine cleavage system aminomethyltransferase GcvT [Gammaproteobacteria bacterium]|nr:glycine cleavage system aminomethyltransferase GcvT [Gammaproteobacteria bacterium]
MRTFLYPEHVKAGARFVSFAGWEMPLRYVSQVDEHHAVRTRAGCFDVSHMGVVDIEGPSAKPLLSYLLSSDINRLENVGSSFYTLMLNSEAGIIDDLIVYRTEWGYRTIVNAGTKSTDLIHINEIKNHLESQVSITLREDLNIVAVQGPNAVAICEEVLGSSKIESLSRFHATTINQMFVARTGYTGEDGVEIVANNESIANLWQSLVAKGVQPCGLAARDSLRLEAGLNLNTQDMTNDTVPDEVNLKWTVHMEPDGRDFHGRQSLEYKRSAGLSAKLTGVVLEDKGIARHDCLVMTNSGEGRITSGLFSPTLGYGVGLARVPVDAKGSCQVKVRKRELGARLVRPPFVRNGVRVHK